MAIADNNSCVRSRRWLGAVEVERVVVASQKLGAEQMDKWMQMQAQGGSEWTSDQRPACERRALRRQRKERSMGRSAESVRRRGRRQWIATVR